MAPILTKQQREDIAEGFKSGFTVSALCKEYGVSPPTIYRILRAHQIDLKNDYDKHSRSGVARKSFLPGEFTKVQCCFKIGKYFLEGPSYKNAMVKMLADNKANSIDALFYFGLETGFEKLNITITQFIAELKKVCEHADRIPGFLKAQIIDDYTTWRDNELPKQLQSGRDSGKAVFEPCI